MDMIGHNSSTGTALHQLNAAVAGLGLALQDARTIRTDDRKQMVLVGRHLLAIDIATANNEELSDKQIREAGIVLPSDIIASASERGLARWLARGGVIFSDMEKTPNEINDLAVGSLNPLEARFLTGKKFAKVTSYIGIYGAFARECKVEIRKAFDGGDGALTLDDVRKAYSDVLFLSTTIETWIAEEEYRRSDEYARVQNLKKAWAMRVDEAIEEAQKASTAEPFDRLEAQVKKQLDRIHKLAAQKRAEDEAKAKAKENAAKLTSAQKRTLAAATRNEQEGEEPMEYSDDDDNA